MRNLTATDFGFDPAPQPDVPVFVDTARDLPFYDPEIGLIQESRAARQASQGLRIWQRVYAARR